jgi:hypothetical protein
LNALTNPTDHQETLQQCHGNATAVTHCYKCEGEEEMKKAGVLLFMEHY